MSLTVVLHMSTQRSQNSFVRRILLFIDKRDFLPVNHYVLTYFKPSCYILLGVLFPCESMVHVQAYVFYGYVPYNMCPLFIRFRLKVLVVSSVLLRLNVSQNVKSKNSGVLRPPDLYTILVSVVTKVYAVSLPYNLLLRFVRHADQNFWVRKLPFSLRFGCFKFLRREF